MPETPDTTSNGHNEDGQSYPASRATIGDVEWLDSFGATQICGHRFTRADVTSAEEPGDRRDDGRLTVAAKERIALLLTGDIARRDHYRLQLWISQHPGLDPIFRDYDG